jgi:cytochrome c oxidase subunit 2
MRPKLRRQNWRHLLITCPIIAVLSFALAFLFLRVNFIPNAASTERGAIDDLLKLQFAIAGIFFAIVVTVFTYALIAFRRRSGDKSDAPPVSGNTALEVVWTLIPLAVVTVMGTYGAFVLDRMTTPPPVSQDQSELQVDVRVPSGRCQGL